MELNTFAQALLTATGWLAPLTAAVANSNLSTVADPGCLAGKAAITDNVDKLSSGDPRPGFTATIEGLRDAADKADTTACAMR